MKFYKGLFWGLLFSLLIWALTITAFADRTEDLVKENQEFNQQIVQRQNEITQLTQQIIENIGRIKELKKIEGDKEK